MKSIRKSYIPEMKSDVNLTWPVVTIVTFMIVLVLIILLVFGYFDGISNIITSNERNIAKETVNADIKKAEESLATLEQKVTTAKATLDGLEKPAEEKAKLYESINGISSVKTNITQRLKDSLDKKGLLKSNQDKIFIAPTGNLVLTNDFVFEKDKTIMTKDANEAAVLLSVELVKILSDENISKYVKNIVIESHLDGEINDIKKLDATTKGATFVSTILSSNATLNSTEKMKQKIISGNFLDSRPIVEGTDAVAVQKNSRIEIGIILDDKALLSAVEEFKK